MSLKLFVNGVDVPVKIINFSDGASNLFIDPSLIPPRPEYYTVYVEPSTRINDIYAELKHFIDVMERDWPEIQRRHLYLPYLPDGRADRAFAKGYAFPLQVFINDMIFHFSEVTFVDPHNPEAVRAIISKMIPILGMNLIPNINIISQAAIFATMRKQTDNFGIADDIVLVSPDKGAIGKTNEIVELLGLEVPSVIYFDKVRDVHSGQITSIDIANEHDANYIVHDVEEGGKFTHFVVVDDICDGGGTFVPIAKRLRALLEQYKVPPSQYRITLYVTHGIFSKGLQGLNEFDAIHVNHIVANYVTQDDIKAFNSRTKITIQD